VNLCGQAKPVCAPAAFALLIFAPGAWIAHLTDGPAVWSLYAINLPALWLISRN